MSQGLKGNESGTDTHSVPDSLSIRCRAYTMLLRKAENILKKNS